MKKILIVVSSNDTSSIFNCFDVSNFNEIYHDSCGFCWTNEEEEIEISGIMNKIYESIPNCTFEIIHV